MAKVGFVSIRFSGKRNAQHPIYFKEGKGYYVKDLPDDFSALTGFEDKLYSKEQELTAQLKRCCHVYRAKKSVAKKVIAYKIISSYELLYSGDKGGQGVEFKEGITEKVHLPSYKLDNPPKALFGVDFHVLEALQDEDGGTYYKVSDTGRVPFSMGSEEQYVFVEYTPEREAFFLSVMTFLRQLIQFSARYVSGNSKEVEAAIESTRFDIDAISSFIKELKALKENNINPAQ